MSKLKNKEWCNKQYWALERSIADIAKELDTYPNKVRRALKSHGIKLRDNPLLRIGKTCQMKSWNPGKSRLESNGKT